MATLKERLDAYKGQPEQPWTSRKKLSVSEKGQKYSLSLTGGADCAVYAVDGGIINDKKTCRCDKLILIAAGMDRWCEVLVELKGQDIHHAIEQLESTLNNPLFQSPEVVEKQARVVGRRIPSTSGNADVERAKKRFLSKYHFRLKCLSSPGIETYPFRKG